MNIYYIYAYLREDGSPYYIGKGKGNRANIKRGTHNPPKDKKYTIFLDKNLTEEQAFQLEKDYISILGRKDNGTGILRNLTDGGEGTSGHKHSDISKKKMSKSNTGRIVSEETKKKLSLIRTGKKIKRISISNRLGKKHSVESRLKMSLARIGKKHSLETKIKLKRNHKGRTGLKFSKETRLKMSISQKKRFTSQ